MKTNAETTTETKAATVAEQGAPVAPEKAPSKKNASPKKGAPKGGKTANATKPAKKAKGGRNAAAKPHRNAAGPRPESKGAQILDLIRRPKGATLAEIMKATGWQAHSVRGFISTAGKKRDVTIESTKEESGVRTYKAR